MKSAIEYVAKTIEEIKEQGLYKSERIITTPQRDMIATTTNFGVINMCANNYLGLRLPKGHQGGKEACDRWGTDLLSRSSAGRRRYTRISNLQNGFLGKEDTILFPPASIERGSLNRCSENDAV